MDNSKAEKTISLISKGMDEGQCAAIPDMLRMIHSLSDKVGNLPIQQLAEVVKNDTVVLEKVISAANTVGFNPSGAEITTIGQAIQVIGFSRVRSLAMSLILLENSNAWQFSDERRRATLSSLTSGLLAEQMAGSTSVLNPDVAFLCGALRGFAHIVMATFMLDEFKKAEELAEELPSDTAYKEIFGLTPLELGHHLMDSKNLSSVLLKTLKQYNPENYKNTLATPEMRLLGVADYAYQLAQVALDDDISESDFRKAHHILRKRYQDAVEVPTKQLDAILEETGSYLKKLSNSSSNSEFAKRAIDCLGFRAERVDPPNPVKRTPKKAMTPALVEAKHRKEQALRDGLAKLEQFAEKAGDSRKKSIELLLKSIRQGLEADECWAFLKKSGKQGYHFSHGIGAHSLLLEGRASFLIKQHNIFSLCLLRKETIFIGNAHDPKVKPYLPDWFVRNVDLISFVLLCMQNKEGVHGLIFAGWKTTRQTNIPEEHVKLIHDLMKTVGKLS